MNDLIMIEAIVGNVNYKVFCSSRDQGVIILHDYLERHNRLGDLTMEKLDSLVGSTEIWGGMVLEQKYQ